MSKEIQFDDILNRLREIFDDYRKNHNSTKLEFYISNLIPDLNKKIINMVNTIDQKIFLNSIIQEYDNFKNMPSTTGLEEWQKEFDRRGTIVIDLEVWINKWKDICDEGKIDNLLQSKEDIMSILNAGYLDRGLIYDEQGNVDDVYFEKLTSEENEELIVELKQCEISIKEIFKEQAIEEDSPIDKIETLRKLEFYSTKKILELVFYEFHFKGLKESLNIFLDVITKNNGQLTFEKDIQEYAVGGVLKELVSKGHIKSPEKVKFVRPAKAPSPKEVKYKRLIESYRVATTRAHMSEWLNKLIGSIVSKS